MGDPGKTEAGVRRIVVNTLSLFCFLGVGGVPLVHEAVER